MGCGVNAVRTVIAIGDIPIETILELTKRDRVRVLHVGGAALEESDTYKSIPAIGSDRIKAMALFMQFSPSLILCDDNVFTEELFTVCREQWTGEYDTSSLLVYDDGIVSKIGFHTEEFPPEYDLQVDPLTIFDSLLK